MYRNTYAEVDLSSIAHNIQAIKSVLSADTKIMAVVKADAYGHGIVPVSKAALRAGATWLAIALPEEAIPLVEEKISCPILVMGRSNNSQKMLAVTLGLRQCVSDASEIQELAQIAQEQKTHAFVHVKVDTGMGRIGVRSTIEFMHMIEAFRSNDSVIFDGIFTHFACSDDMDKCFTHEQNDLFKKYVDIARKNGFSPLAHASSSAASIDLPEMQYGAIRLGISMYGYYPSCHVCRELVGLKPAMQVYTEICHLKDIKKGDPVGYGSTWKAQKKTTVATLPIGYGDGYNRLLSNRGQAIVIAGGKPYMVPVIGRVCMDQIMVDVTGIPARLGDRVIAMGSVDGKNVDADEIARICETISYEILLSYTARVPRVYVGA